MFKIEWDKTTGGVILTSKTTINSLGVTPRPVFWEELKMLRLDDDFNWIFPEADAPLLWACNKKYYYRGEFVFEVKGANVYDSATIIIQPNANDLELEPVDIDAMLTACKDEMFLIESEAIEFIRSVYVQYSSASRSVNNVKANQVDYETLLAKAEKSTKRQMAIVKQDCDSFDIEPLDLVKESGKRVYQTTRIDKFIASFSGGKDSQVVLDLCTRAIPPSEFEVIYSDTGYELPPSLSLYEETISKYKMRFPELKFSTTRNHESVLHYWDKIGTPSDTHRWCCSVMKTAPLYRSLKIDGTNKQAKVLAFEGTRGEESNKRSNYPRIGKGVKHNGVINARPIYKWNTTEVFLYLLKHSISLNDAYRKGKPRVGCVICPFSSEWDDMIVNKFYPNELSPFLQRIETMAKSRNIPNLEEYVKGHKWKLRSSGKFMNVLNSVTFDKSKNNFSGNIENSSFSIETWLPTIGDYRITTQENKAFGEIKIQNKIYPFIFENKDNKSISFSFKNLTDPTLIGLLRRSIYKSAYCIQCEACEVECPTGALSVYPEVKIDSSKCTHCYKCLNFHAKGCIVADSISMSESTNLKLTNISGYGTFGLREEWLSEYFADHNSFWRNNSLGNKQIDSFKSWLKDAGIIDSKKNITEIGLLLASNYVDNYYLVWEIIWINLVHNSTLINWFLKNTPLNVVYSKTKLQSIYEMQYSEGLKTFEYSLGALFNLFSTSPVGSEFRQKIDVSKTEYNRETYDSISEISLAYSIYKFAELNNVKSLRISDFYQDNVESGFFVEFGIGKQDIEKTLRILNSSTNRVLIAELNTGLDHISLRDDLNSFEVLKILIS